MTAGLSTRERRFVEEFVIDLNATAAALRAGYGKGTNYSVAGRQAFLLRRKARVAEAIAKLIEQRPRARALAERRPTRRRYR